MLDIATITAGDFIYCGRRRIGLLRPGTIPGHLSATIGDVHLVNLKTPQMTMTATRCDLILVKREEIKRIAHAFAERVQATEHVSVDDRRAASKLLDEKGRYLDAVELFEDPYDHHLYEIFEDIVSEMRVSNEVKRVACLAILSVYLSE